MKWVCLGARALVVRANFCASHVVGREGNSVYRGECVFAGAPPGFAWETVGGEEFLRRGGVCLLELRTEF